MIRLDIYIKNIHRFHFIFGILIGGKNFILVGIKLQVLVLVLVDIL